MLLLENLTIKEKSIDKDANHSSFLFHYLPSTIGLTIGNCLRRVLLTSIKGLAPIAIEISDNNGPVKSKFTSLSGARETTPYLIINCKKIILEIKEKNGDVFSTELDIKNDSDDEREVTAKDFQLPDNFKIKNPEIYLTTLAPFSSLKIKLYWREDYGYHQSEEQKKYLTDKENIIFLDSDYSPVKGDGVNFQINTVVVGLDEKKEELVLNIKTNGSINPKEVLKEGLEVISQLISTSRKAL
jgi:DNA-directed RNA polymerase subunit alpha